jgi:putative membrane protein
MGWWMVFGGIFLVLFLGGIIALIVWGINKASPGNGSSSGSARKINPLDIAAERYAKGEISRADFEQIKKDLTEP